MDGQFSYNPGNQRALPFNVIIKEIAKEDRLYLGSNSKCTSARSFQKVY